MLLIYALRVDGRTDRHTAMWWRDGVSLSLSLSLLTYICFVKTNAPDPLELAWLQGGTPANTHNLPGNPRPFYPQGLMIN